MNLKTIYSIDGSKLTPDSTIAVDGIVVITDSTKLLTAYLDTDTNNISSTSVRYIRLLSPDYYTQKYYMSHVLIGALVNCKDIPSYVQRQISIHKTNVFWCFLEDYSATDDTYIYNRLLKAFLDACTIVGVKCMSGIAYGGNPEQKIKLFQDTWNHNATLQINGRRVYCDYSPFAGILGNIQRALAAAGFTDFLYWTHTLFPINFGGNSTTFIDEYSIGDIGIDGKDFLHWSFAMADGPDSIDHALDTRPFNGGIIQFGFDNYHLSDARRVNNLINMRTKLYGVMSGLMVGHLYTSQAAQQDYGFMGTKALFGDVNSLNPAARPNAMVRITANDYTESTYSGQMLNPPLDGLAFISDLQADSRQRYPAPDHSGMELFDGPDILCFLNGDTLPVYPTDRIFARHELHPWDQAPQPRVPLAFDTNPGIYNSWPNSCYAIPQNYNNITATLNPLSATIYLAAHLTAPAKLKINNVLSTGDYVTPDNTQPATNINPDGTFPAGPAVFSIPADGVLGNPRFAVVRDGVEVLVGYSPQDIYTNFFPGAGGILAVEINPDKKTVIEEAVAMTITHIDPNDPTTKNSITLSHSLGSSEIEISNDWIMDNNSYWWQPYTGIIDIGDYNTEAGRFRFRTRPTNTREASPVVRSPSFTGSITPGNEGVYATYSSHTSHIGLNEIGGTVNEEGYVTPVSSNDPDGCTVEGVMVNGSYMLLTVPADTSLMECQIGISGVDDQDYNNLFYDNGKHALRVLYGSIANLNGVGIPMQTNTKIRIKRIGNDGELAESLNGINFYNNTILIDMFTGFEDAFVKVTPPINDGTPGRGLYSLKLVDFGTPNAENIIFSEVNNIGIVNTNPIEYAAITPNPAGWNNTGLADTQGLAPNTGYLECDISDKSKNSYQYGLTAYTSPTGYPGFIYGIYVSINGIILTNIQGIPGGFSFDASAFKKAYLWPNPISGITEIWGRRTVDNVLIKFFDLGPNNVGIAYPALDINQSVNGTASGLKVSNKQLQ